ncbi:hypothetical protein [Nocardiopsis nanhaiensis]
MIREHEGELRAELGDRASETLLTEGRVLGPHLESLTWGAIEAAAPA